MKSHKSITLAGTILIGLILIILPLISACPSTTPQTTTPPTEVIKLSSAEYHPTTARWSILHEEFDKEIEKRTGGQVEITYYSAGSLLGGPDMLDGVIQGTADIGQTNCMYNRGRFPVSEVFSVPLGIPDSWVATHVAYDFFEEYKPAEWDDIHVLAWHLAVSGPQVHTTTKPVRKLEDLTGLTIRTGGRVSDIFEALGATPRDVPMGELYEALSKGVIDGWAGSFDASSGFRLGEVCKYSTFSPSVGNVFYVFYMFMNKDKWNSLPEDVQQVINEVSEEYKPQFALGWNEQDIAGMEYCLSLGNEIIELTPEESARWTASLQPVIDEYVEEMVALGFSEEEVKGWMEFVKERNAYWIDKEEELDIPTIWE